ncbi:RNA helicase [Coemansia sp. RSA 2336]|nr:RNA helicase [Coemansia sp. RSA 2336]
MRWSLATATVRVGALASAEFVLFYRPLQQIAFSSRPYHTTRVCERSGANARKHREKLLKAKERATRLPDFGEKFEIGSRRSKADTGKQSGTIRLTTAALEWPLDADIDEKFAAKIRRQRLSTFCDSKDARRRCAYFGITDEQFTHWSEEFSKAVLNEKVERMKPSALVHLLVRNRLQGLDNYIVNQFFAFLESDAPHVVTDLKYLREITDLRYPQEWAPSARTAKRKVIMHVGPTNSGKTYHALQRLKESRIGFYCSPLRLLAYEVYNRMSAAGISCSLITGEERLYPDYDTQRIKPIGYTADQLPISQVVSCTIEMLPPNAVDVAVIDEIQMISDRQRGWAWTNALLSVNALELHLCGEPSAVPLVKRICAILDEKVEVREYKRLGQLEVSPKSLEGKWENVQKGDCVVTFSRKNIYDIKKTIESATKMKCAVIYGGLPPESRVKQAELFNDPSSGYDVLVASDAVGMGINLSIKRMVFTALSKFDGDVVRPISVSQTRQIGGRAGRFSSGNEVGTVVAMESSDVDKLTKSMNSIPPELDAAGLKPTTAMIEMFSHQFPRVPFSQLWGMFRDICNVEDHYFLCSFDDQEEVAKVIEKLPLSVSERYQLIYSPVNAKDEIMKQCLFQYAKAIAYKQECLVDKVIRLPEKPPKNRDDIKVLESWHRSITLYMWLAYHFMSIFPQLPQATCVKEECENAIQNGLVGLRTSTKTKQVSNDSKDIRKALGLI